MNGPWFGTLVSARQLALHIDEPNWRVLDCRHDLANPDFGRAAYASGHLPGAVFLHLDEDLSGPMTGKNGRHPLPDPEKLARRMDDCGVDENTQVVAYDDAGGMFAARLWWLLRWLGHEHVAVLDGGLHAWCRGAQILSTKPATPPAAKFTPRPHASAVDADYVARHLASSEMVLIDARSPDRYRGENESLDPVAGHIPGAANRFFRDNLAPDGLFKQPSVLREEFGAFLKGHSPDRIVHQCGSGVTACHNVLAMEVAGLSGSRLYAGSWSEWCADPARPVATGPAA